MEARQLLLDAIIDVKASKVSYLELDTIIRSICKLKRIKRNDLILSCEAEMKSICPESDMIGLFSI